MNSHNQFRITPDLLASKGQRILNYLIDLLPQYAINYGFAYGFYYLGEFTGNYVLNDYWNNMSVIEDLIVSYGFFVLYYFAMESTTKRTLGKYVTNTMVIKTNGEEVTNSNILKRTLSRLIPFDGLSFLGVNGKGWHDSIADTYVIDIKKYTEKKTLVTDLDQLGKPEELGSHETQF